MPLLKKQHRFTATSLVLVLHAVSSLRRARGGRKRYSRNLRVRPRLPGPARQRVLGYALTKRNKAVSF